MATRISEFWSRTASDAAGTKIAYLSAIARVSLSEVANATLASWRKKTSVSAYSRRWSSASVRAALPTTSDCVILFFSSCHAPGASVLSVCTSTASKMAQQRSWSGIETASSSAEIAGYLSFLILPSIAHGFFSATAPPLPATGSDVSKKNADHWLNHASPSGIASR